MFVGSINLQLLFLNAPEERCFSFFAVMLQIIAPIANCHALL
jgi:hypothetical protein